MTSFDTMWRARFERFGRSSAEEHAISGWSAEGLARRRRLFGALLHRLALPPGARVLELGCGAGTYVRLLAAHGHVTIGVDYALPALSRAVAADPGHARRYLAADGHDLPFADRSFDLVICIGVLQAVGRPRRVLDETARVLAPGGSVVLEALNALAVPAVSRRLLDAARGQTPRLRRYAAARVSRWCRARGLVPLEQVAVYLPPRRFPRLGALLDRPPVVRALEAMPAAAALVAHAFWLVARRAA